MHVTDNSKFLQPKDLSASHLQLAVKQSGGEGDISNGAVPFIATGKSCSCSLV